MYDLGEALWALIFRLQEGFGIVLMRIVHRLEQWEKHFRRRADYWRQRSKASEASEGSGRDEKE